MPDLPLALCFWYRVIVASEPLLTLAIAASSGPLKAYYERHLDEERGHHEMLRDDLYRLGVTAIPYSHLAAQLAGSQYYLLAHDDPALLLGYMAALETGTLRVDEVDGLSQQCGVELTCLRHHAAHDPHHQADLEAMIESLDAVTKAHVRWNQNGVNALLNRLLPEID